MSTRRGAVHNTDEDNLTDNAVMGINIKWPEFNITITQIHEDTETLVKTFRVQNLGDTITDFSITIDDSLKDGAYIYPSVTHYNLVKDGSMEFFVIPLFKESGDIIEGNMIALWADGFKNYPLKFECLEGRRPYMAIAEMPMYVCDLSGWYCTNNPDIRIPFTIPPGFNMSDVISAKIEMDFSLPWDQSAYTPHDVYLSVNGKDVGAIMNSIPEGGYVFEFAPGVLNYGNFSSADNVIRIDTKHLPQSHYVVNTKIRIKLCLKKLERWICAPDEDTAIDHIWKTPGIEKNYPHLNVSILSPFEGEKLVLGRPVLINVSVMGNENDSTILRAQRFAKVKADFGNENIELFPLDDGMHGDGHDDDGIYACTWIPQIPGNTTITVKASNCRADNEGSNSTNVWIVVPDLNVTSLNVTPMGLVEGNPAKINFKVTNIGSALAGPYKDELYVDGKMEYLSKKYSLIPGESHTWNYNYTFTIGNHTLRACTDVMGDVSELDENNNCNTTSIYIPPSLDLNVTSIGFDGDLYEGSPITIYVNVTNSGNGTIGEHNDSLSIGGKQVKSTRVGALKSGETCTWSYNCTLTGGYHTIGACTDTNDTVNEVNEINNCKSITIPVINRSDLNITEINVSGEFLEGEPINISVNVTNQGNETAGTHTDRLFIDKAISYTTEPITLIPRENHTWRYNRTFTAGNHIIRACTDTNDTVNETNESNNCRNTTFYVWPKSDLNITDINVTGELLEGEPINISIQIENLGNGTAESNMNNLTIDGMHINSTIMGSMSKGERYIWNYVDNFTAGSHTISACTDASDEVKELNEGNNCRNTAFYIWPKSDLNVTDINVSGELLEGEPINISVNVANLGRGTAGNHRDSLNIDGKLINSTNMGALLLGKDSTWRYNRTFTAGNHIISACTDTNDTVNEANESNNCKVIPVYISPLPDLNVTDIMVSEERLEGEPINISINIANLGNKTAGNHTDRLSIDDELSYNSTRKEMLSPEENYTWSSSYNFTAGDHTIRACTDTLSTVNESNEGNNCRNTAFYVWPKSDLNVTDINVSGEFLEGEPINISVNVTNLGNGTARTHEDHLSIDETQIASADMGAHYPKEERTWICNYTFTTPGNHTIRACMDAPGDLKESNESNNCRDRTIYISPRLSDLNITDIRITGDHLEGLPMVISVNATNKGKNVSGNHTDKLSIDGNKANLTNIGALLPNKNSTWICNYIFTPGYHTISACTDINNTIEESSENNNCINVTIHIDRRIPDLNVTDINVSEERLEGEPINISVNVTNQGNDTASSHRDLLTIDGTLANSTEIGPHLNGTSYSLYYNYTGAAGTHNITACADAMGTVNEFNKNNNCKSRTIDIGFRSDLNITGIRVGGRLVEKAPINISVDDTNIGKGLAGNHTDGLFIDGEQVNLIKVKPLKPGKTCTWSYNYCFTPGNHTIRAYADINGTVKEFKEDNNSRTRTIHVDPLPDLNVTGIQFQGDSLEGSPITISVNVSNIGNDTAENHTDSLLIDGKLSNISMESRTLDKNDSYIWSCSHVFAAGNYTISACTDTNNTIDESDESNNCRNRTLQIWPLPDLIITSIKLIGNLSEGSSTNISVNEGSPVNISVNAINLGNGIAWNYTDRLFIDGNEEPLIEFPCLKMIVPGKSYVLNYSRNLSSGRHHISAHADWSMNLKEINNENNDVHIDINVVVIPRIKQTTSRNIPGTGDGHTIVADG